MQGMPTLIEGLLFTNECDDPTNHIASRSTFQFPKFFKLAIPQRLERTATEGNTIKETSRERPKSASYPRLKNSKRTSKFQSIGELGPLF